MGLFGGNPDKGLYTGDAPVSMPGRGGQPPQRYAGSQRIDHDDHAVRPSQRDAAPGIIAARPKKSGSGTAVVVLFFLGILVAGFVMFAQSSTEKSASPDQAVTEVVGGDSGDADTVERRAMTESATVTYFDATFAITPKAAFAQPGRGYADATPDDEPELLISTGIQRLDDGSKPTGPTVFNWKFDTPDGVTIDAEIVPTYYPKLDVVSLAGGESDSGYLVFRTNATEGALRFTSFSGDTLASWDITSDWIGTVVGNLGEPVWADISIPRFTVAAAEPHRVASGGPELRTPPESGHYLLFDIDIVANKGASGALGLVDRESFGFLPDGTATAEDDFAGLVLPAYGAVDGTLSTIAIGTGSAEHATLAFDTDATDGWLYFFNAGGWALIKWPVSVG